MNRPYFPTSILDAALAERRLQNEQVRQRLLEATLAWLAAKAGEYGFESGYVFGSVTQAGKFAEDSDIDVAIDSMSQGEPFRMAGDLSLVLNREVDVVPLDRCHFADHVRQLGVKWIATVI
ncbi:MAG: nucleotidyltransferase domain-containing protein [Thermosynechococcaceae cyanobacterium]